jgi:primosomal protein N' (replication factor Y)
MSDLSVVQVAVPAPLRRTFDYLLPATLAAPVVGARVRVPFGRRQAIGVVLAVRAHSEIPASKLRLLLAVLDTQPVLDCTLLALLRWAADYYHYPLGEVIHAALPALLRQGRGAAMAGVERWSLTDAGGALTVQSFARAPAQQRLWEALRAQLELTAGDAAALSARAPSLLRDWEVKGWARKTAGECLPTPLASTLAPPPLSADQARAVQEVRAGDDAFRCFLLYGVTGSGKTEVYLQLVARALAMQRQALVLVPEIGLTPQLVERFRRRFAVPIAVLHSGLNDSERLCAWLAAASGRAPIVLGTRSAVFTPLRDLGLIVVDEEHDPSYKQQDGFRYHARDVAIVRAQRAKVPIVLGSATPSFESLHNARSGRYALLQLPERAGAAALPTVHLLDMRRLPRIEGLAQPLLKLIGERLARGEQSLLFLNRRGFAPVLLCHDCGWLAPCPRCDARMTLHKRHQELRCHHCDTQRPVPATCPECGSGELHGLGEGTQRIEEILPRYFPTARILRIDRDSTRRKGALQAQLDQVHAGEADILVGTQMLSKGHDFPKVTLVAVLNADQGLYGSDFRAPEHLFQQIMQVAGRAGRAERAGEVFIQTYHPEHPLFAALCAHDYAGFADYALTERSQAAYPPFAHLALLRAEAVQPQAALQFLAQARALAAPLTDPAHVQLTDPVPAPMERRAGRYRAQLLVQSAQRGALHAFITRWLAALEDEPSAKKVRWSLDIDPLLMQ